ncbi:MAG: peptide deformylase [Candidatus Eisenbacteria bacterium]
MAVRPIRLYGDPVLRRLSEPVETIDDDTVNLISSLVATVDHAAGLGLAAPQIGVTKRVIVVVHIDDEGRRKHLVLVNPEIVSACGEVTGEEGCLSIPGIYSNVKRPESVVVEGLDAEGGEISIEAKGVMARAFSHEIDHLDGVMFVDKLGVVKRSLLKKKLSEIRKRAKEMAKSPL